MEDRDKRIVDREGKFLNEAMKSKDWLKQRYDEVLKIGGATPRDLAYLRAYNELLEADPLMAQVVAEVYSASDLESNQLYKELQAEKDQAIKNQDFELAATLQQKKERLTTRINQSLPTLLTEFSQRISSLTRKIEED